MSRKHMARVIVSCTLIYFLALPSLVQGAPQAEGDDPSTALNDPLLVGSEADDLDALLDLAEEDFGQVAQVNVTAPSLDVEVTTVSRKASTVGRSAAAVFVISEEMIRRSGAINVPQVLRMAPGVQVAQISAHQWAISIRGFNGLYSNRLQLQVDGRSLYTPLFGGVIWGSQDVPLSEIERIEIIRGPGASVWGANAVNGIINIMTKSAKDTEGLLIRAGTGTVENGMGNVRYGTELDHGVFARVYGSWIEHDHHVSGPVPAADDYRFKRVGIRIDNIQNPDSQHTLLLNYYEGSGGVGSVSPNLTTPPFVENVQSDQTSHGVNVQWQWDYVYSEQTKSSFRMYYDRNVVRSPFSTSQPKLDSGIDIFDADYQVQHTLNRRHSLVMGSQFRYSQNEIVGVPGVLEFARPQTDFYLVSAFLQDEMTLIEEKLWLTLGAKLSENEFSGFEFQPTARLLWLPDEKHSVWAAVSRATRLPTFFEVDGTITLPGTTSGPLTIFPRQSPADTFEGRDVTAFEIGVRGQPTDQFSWDVAAFFNQYQNLGEGGDPVLTPIAPGLIIAEQQRGNGGTAESYGVELASIWDISDDFRIRGAYTHTQVYGVSADIASTAAHQVYLQTSVDFSPTVEGDVIWRYVDSIPGVVSHYNVMDLRLAWRPRKSFEWSVVARNLLDSKHPEFGWTQSGGAFTQVPTSVYSMVTFEF